MGKWSAKQRAGFFTGDIELLPPDLIAELRPSFIAGLAVFGLIGVGFSERRK